MEYYVVWQNRDGGIEGDEVTIDGPITSVGIVKNAVRDTLSYWKQDDVATIISWQPFDTEEDETVRTQ